MKRLCLVGLIVFFTGLAYAQEPIPAAKVGQQYGAKFEVKNSISVPELGVTLENTDEFKGQVQGEVLEVCKKKGCFIRVNAGEGKDPVMVRFLDYGFFMPQDIVGKQVVLDATASIKETSVERLQHYAQDAGMDASEIARITEPKKEVIIIASGVKVVE